MMATARERAREAVRATVPAWKRSHPEYSDANWKFRADMQADTASDVWEAFLKRTVATLDLGICSDCRHRGSVTELRNELKEALGL